MSGFRITVDISGVEAYTRKLSNLQGRLVRARDFFDYILDDFHAIELETWEQGQGAWQEWTAWYSGWRSGRKNTKAFGAFRRAPVGNLSRTMGGQFTGKAALGDEILTFSGAMKSDMTEGVLAGPTDTGVLVGTDQPYAQYHMSGVGAMRGLALRSKKQPVTMPARPFMGVTESDERRWRHAREVWMQEQIFRSRLGGASNWQQIRRVRDAD
jgi:phage gpG-like protein